VGLTSGWLLGLMIVLAAALSVGTIWVWPKLARQGIKPVLARIGLFVGAQVSFLAVLLLAVNSYFIFYSSWGDLLGTTTAAGALQTNSSGKPESGSPGHPLARSVTSFGSIKKGADPAKVGRIESVQIQGIRTGLSTQAYVFLPPQYFQKAFANRRFPVVIDFTGYPGDAKATISRLHVPQLATSLVASGRMQPTIYVMTRPTPTSLGNRDTECTDIPAGPEVASFYIQDLPEAITNTYRVATSYKGWGVMGDSTGGYCAVKLAMLASDRFTAAVSISGYFFPRQDFTTGDLYGHSALVKDDNSLIWRLQHLPPPPISVLVTTSLQGETDYGEAKKFLALARSPMLSDKILTPQGGHNPRTWKLVMPGCLQWLSNHLQHEGS
jgi:enterochelin esterase-like enzyme